MGIEIRSHNHASELISLSGTYLEQNESENNLPIGLAYKLSEAPHYYGSKSPLLLSILEDERVVGVAIMTPPRQGYLVFGSDLGFRSQMLRFSRNIASTARSYSGKMFTHIK